MWVLISDRVRGGYKFCEFIKLYNDVEKAKLELNQTIKELHSKNKIISLYIDVDTGDKTYAATFDEWDNYIDVFNKQIMNREFININMISRKTDFIHFIVLKEVFEEDDYRNIKRSNNI